MNFEHGGLEISDIAEHIKGVKDVYECGHRQVLITLKNRFQISCIKGFGTYSDDTTVEVAVFNPQGCFCFLPDDVEGWVTRERFEEIITQVALLDWRDFRNVPHTQVEVRKTV
jgi:hypothetical protein